MDEMLFPSKPRAKKPATDEPSLFETPDTGRCGDCDFCMVDLPCREMGKQQAMLPETETRA